MKKNILIILVVIVVICGTSIWISTDFLNQKPGFYYSAAVSEDPSVDSAKLQRLLDNYNLISMIETGLQTFSGSDIDQAVLVGTFNLGLDGLNGKGSLYLEGPGDFILIEPNGFFQGLNNGQFGDNEGQETGPYFSAGLMPAAFMGYGGGSGVFGGGNLLGGGITIGRGMGESLQSDEHGFQDGSGMSNDNPGANNPPGTPPVPVPEPITLLLVGVGLIGAACSRRRKRRVH
jgi:hypothetical protein